MNYLNIETLRSIDPGAFRTRDPFPWTNPRGILTEAGYRELLATMPPVERFTPFFGKVRKHGQKSHERYVLEYTDDVELPEPWTRFIGELRSDPYRAFIRELLGGVPFKFRFHWHYTPNGCSVSPHCDARGKLGSHIFYLNSREDWDPAWGGETVILDDHGRFAAQSNPEFSDFDTAVPAETMDNHSLIFGRRGNSWHGVREIQCPEGALRKVFIVVFEDADPKRMLVKRLKRLVKGKPLTTEKERAMY
jgi:hypothetical protein